MQMAESPQGTGEEGLGTNQALFYVQSRDHNLQLHSWLILSPDISLRISWL